MDRGAMAGSRRLSWDFVGVIMSLRDVFEREIVAGQRAMTAQTIGPTWGWVNDDAWQNRLDIAKRD
jgi:hypothetical protein